MMISLGRAANLLRTCVKKWKYHTLPLPRTMGFHSPYVTNLKISKWKKKLSNGDDGNMNIEI